MEFLQKLKNSFQHITKTTVVWLWMAIGLLLYWLTCTQGSWSVIGHQLMLSLPPVLLIMILALLRERSMLAGIPAILLVLVKMPMIFKFDREWIINAFPIVVLVGAAIFYMFFRSQTDPEDLPVRRLSKRDFSMVMIAILVTTIGLFLIGCVLYGGVSFGNAFTHTNMTLSFIQHMLIVVAEVIGWVVGLILVCLNVSDGWLFLMIPQFGSLILNNGNIFGSQLGIFLALVLCICAYFDPQWKPKEARK